MMTMIHTLVSAFALHVVSFHATWKTAIKTIRRHRRHRKTAIKTIRKLSNDDDDGDYDDEEYYDDDDGFHDVDDDGKTARKTCGTKCPCGTKCVHDLL